MFSAKVKFAEVAVTFDQKTMIRSCLISNFVPNMNKLPPDVIKILDSH